MTFILFDNTYHSDCAKSVYGHYIVCNKYKTIQERRLLLDETKLLLAQEDIVFHVDTDVIMDENLHEFYAVMHIKLTGL